MIDSASTMDEDSFVDEPISATSDDSLDAEELSALGEVDNFSYVDESDIGTNDLKTDSLSRNDKILFL
jgi:hypothetical protein